MKLHEVIPALLEGKEIRQTSAPDLHFLMARGADEKLLVMYSPQSLATPLSTSFSAEDLFAEDWEVVE